MRSMRTAACRFLLIAIACACVFACGTERDIFGSLDNVPSSGVAPYTKVDLDPDTELTQPFLIVPETADVEYREPAILARDDRFYLWVEVGRFLGADQSNAHTSSAIRLFESDSAASWIDANGGEPVFAAEREWEADRVGAPTVIHHGGAFRMWYVGADGAGIGAASSPDGLTWTRLSDAPVLTPTQGWESGTVSAPCVVFHDGLFRLWYSAGANGTRIGVATGTAIGYAESVDGLTWTKPRDAPVLTAWQPWESGAVSSPTVVVDRTVARTIYRLWYTGNRPGDPFVDDASVGYAGSLNGLDWEKAEPPVNPVLQELFPLDFEGISDYLLYDECQPTVVRDGDLWVMVYIQIDALNLLSGGLRGVSLATNPPATVR